MEVDAAGLSNDADMPLENEQIAWATHLVVMEKAQAARLRRRFGNLVSGRKIVCLDIPDDYAFMNDDLIALLKQRIGRVQ